MPMPVAKLYKLLLCTSLLLATVPGVQAASVQAFAVNETTSDGIIIQNKYGDTYFVETFICSVFAGDIIYVETDLLGEPSMFGKITKPNGYLDTKCSISSAHEVTHKARVTSVFDTDDQILVLFGGTQYIVEYGLGCGLSMWRYENKNIYLNIGGSYLDGIGDELVLPNGDDCKIWDAEPIENYSPSTSTPTYYCPTNSHPNPANPAKCLCDTGYELNSNKTACVPYIACPANSYEKSTDNSICICDGNYQWNTNKTQCLSKPKSASTPKAQVKNQTKSSASSTLTKACTRNSDGVCKCPTGFKVINKKGKQVCAK